MRGFTAGVEDVRTVVDRDKRYGRRPNRIQRGETHDQHSAGPRRVRSNDLDSAIGINPLSSGLPLEEVEEADPYFAQSQG